MESLSSITTFCSKDVCQLAVCLAANVACSCPEFGEMSRPRVAKNGDNPVARAQLLCNSNYSNAYFESTSLTREGGIALTVDGTATSHEYPVFLRKPSSHR